MKRFLCVVAICLMILAGAQTGFAFTGLITVDSLNNANLANDSTVPLALDYTDGFSIPFSAGTYTFSVYDGAWNPWGDVILPNRGWVWSMNIYQPSAGSSVWLGDNVTRYGTPAEALNAHLGESVTLDLSTDENLYFYIGDGGNVSDNLGTVTALASSPVPEPATMFLFGAGLIGFAIRRKKT